MHAPDKALTPVSSDNTLSEFIDESKSRLNEILKRLEWHIKPVSWYIPSNKTKEALKVFTYLYFYFLIRILPRILLWEMRNKTTNNWWLTSNRTFLQVVLLTISVLPVYTFIYCPTPFIYCFCSYVYFYIDDEELRKVLGVPDKDVPKRFSDLQLNFSRTEKLSLYEHVIANTNKYTEPEITVG